MQPIGCCEPEKLNGSHQLCQRCHFVAGSAPGQPFGCCVALLEVVYHNAQKALEGVGWG